MGSQFKSLHPQNFSGASHQSSIKLNQKSVLKSAEKYAVKYHKGSFAMSIHSDCYTVMPG